MVQQLQAGAPFTSSLSRMIPIMDLHIIMNHSYHGWEINPMFVDFLGFKRLFFMVHKPVFFFGWVDSYPHCIPIFAWSNCQISIFKRKSPMLSPHHIHYIPMITQKHGWLTTLQCWAPK